MAGGGGGGWIVGDGVGFCNDGQDRTRRDSQSRIVPHCHVPAVDLSVWCTLSAAGGVMVPDSGHNHYLCVVSIVIPRASL